MIHPLRVQDIPDLFLEKGRKNTSGYWVRLDFVNSYLKKEVGEVGLQKSVGGGMYKCDHEWRASFTEQGTIISFYCIHCKRIEKR